MLEILGIADHHEVVVLNVKLEFSREKNLQGSSHPLRLQLAPQPTLVAPDAVHDARYVEKLLAKFKLKLARAAVEHDALVKVRWKRLDHVQQILHSQSHFLVLLVKASVKFFVSQQWCDFRNRSQLHDVNKVKIPQPGFSLTARRLRRESPLELFQVWSPNAIRRRKIDRRILLRLQILRAQMDVDAGVEPRHHPVEHALFQACVAKRVAVDERRKRRTRLRVLRFEAVLQVDGLPYALR